MNAERSMSKVGQYGKVGIVMGSDSDLPVMSKAAEILKQFDI